MNRHYLIISAIVILSFSGCSTHSNRIVDLGVVELAPMTPKKFSCGPDAECTITPGRTVADEIQVTLVVTNQPGSVMKIARNVHSGESGSVSAQDVEVMVIPKLKTP